MVLCTLQWGRPHLSYLQSNVSLYVDLILSCTVKSHQTPFHTCKICVHVNGEYLHFKYRGFSGGAHFTRKGKKMHASNAIFYVKEQFFPCPISAKLSINSAGGTHFWRLSLSCLPYWGRCWLFQEALSFKDLNIARLRLRPSTLIWSKW